MFNVSHRRDVDGLTERSRRYAKICGKIEARLYHDFRPSEIASNTRGNEHWKFLHFCSDLVCNIVELNRIIATKVNSVIAIVRSRNTTRLAVSAVAHALERAQVPLQAFVLNDVDKPALDGFYEYSYSRGKGDQLVQNA